MTNIIKNFWNDEEGATAIEYGLIAGLVAVALIVALGNLEGGLSDLFTSIGTKLSDLSK
ncbi:Flp family type IVb pilin [Comamonas sp.]|uniref:Flp family type IVb pilin n=1 Tax=Comamonas sp. TaxID=34028 RepID=UPI0028AFF623|nr:Flp family type IVb pilin [Comamonas sp.]